MSMTLRGERVSEVASLLSTFSEQEVAIRRFVDRESEKVQARVASYDAVDITADEYVQILRARATETARKLANIGINVEVPA